MSFSKDRVGSLFTQDQVEVAQFVKVQYLSRAHKPHIHILNYFRLMRIARTSLVSKTL